MQSSFSWPSRWMSVYYPLGSQVSGTMGPLDLGLGASKSSQRVQIKGLSSGDRNNQGWNTPKPGVRNSIWISHLSGKKPATWPFTDAFWSSHKWETESKSLLGYHMQSMKKSLGQVGRLTWSYMKPYSNPTFLLLLCLYSTENRIMENLWCDNGLNNITTKARITDPAETTST